MSKLELRGVIVPSHFDNDYFEQYIERGMIIPESRFRSNLEQASKTEPLSVYINSPGGSVFAADEMANSLRAWKADTQQPVNVTIGALAASAASSFAINVASDLTAHDNSKMMFHSATSTTDGGPGAHQDTVELLGKINAGTQETLINKFSVDPDQVSEWFDEGREGWLDANDMKRAGIASQVIGEEAVSPSSFSASDIVNISDRGLDIAALLEVKTEETDARGENESPCESLDDNDKSDPHGIMDEAPPPSDETPDYKRGYTTGLEYRVESVRRSAALLSKMQSSNDSLKHKLRQLEADTVDQANAYSDKVLSLEKTLDETNQKLNKLLSGALHFEATPQTWPEAMRETGNDYVKAAEQYPHLREQYMRDNRTGVVSR